MHRSSLIAVLSGVSLVLSGALALAAAKPAIDGSWDTPGGRVRIALKGTEVTATLTAAADGVKLPVGKQVFRGSFEDNNLSAEIPVDLVLATCHGSRKAFAMLLLTRSGKLTGGVSTKDECAAGVSTLVFKKAADEASSSPAKPAEASPPANEYDANGKRNKPMNSKTKAVLSEAAQYMSEGQFEKARPLFQLVVKHDPIVGEAYNGLGVTFAMRNDYDTAITWYKQGLEAAPGFGDLYYNLACAYSQLGKKSIAVRYLKLAATKGYTDVENVDKDTDLDPIRSEPAFVELRKSLNQTSMTSPVVPPPAPEPPATAAPKPPDAGGSPAAASPVAASPTPGTDAGH